MKIKHGYSRLVFIFSRIVIKLPYAWHIRYPFVYFLFPKKRKADGPIFQSLLEIIKYCASGWQANRLEYTYSRSHAHNPGILPVKSYLFSFVLIQKRGQVLSENDRSWQMALQQLCRDKMPDIDLMRACNFCIAEGRIRLLDYGRKETISCLNAGGLTVLNDLRLIE